MAADIKRTSGTVMRWIWIVLLYLVFVFFSFTWTNNHILYGNYIYPDLDAASWNRAIWMLQASSAAISFGMILLWNFLFSYACLGGRGNEEKIARFLLVVLALLVLAAGSLLTLTFLVINDALNVFALSPPYVFPSLGFIPFLVAAWLFSPNSVKYIGPYKHGRPTVLGG